MPVKRKDKKGRILKEGEYQRRDGKYEYKFLDSTGQRRSVYSWRLVETDATPSGKRVDLSLREKEKNIQRKLDAKIIIGKDNTTLNDLFALHIQFVNLSNATRVNYLYMWEHFIEETFGNKKVSNLKKTDILKFYADQKKAGLSDGTIQIFHKLINPSLQLAVEDHIIPFNPAKGCCKEYSREDALEKIALTSEQLCIFFNEVKKHRCWQEYELIFRIMLGLACRRGELIGLTWKNINMQDRLVVIDHSVLYRIKDGKSQFYAKETKTRNSRTIPMTQEVYECFLKLHKNIEKILTTAKVDGYSDFVFTSANGTTPLYPDNLNIFLGKVVSRYNKNAKEPLPKISTHTFRHTGCTRMAEAGIDINTLCYIMGHKSYKMVFKVYDHVNLDRVKKEMNKMDFMMKNKVNHFS